MSVPELYRDLARRAAALGTSKQCECGIDREPVRVIDGCMVFLVCRVCGGATTERRS